MKIHALILALAFGELISARADSPDGLAPVSPPPATAQTEQKLKTITLTLDFNNATIEEATMFLRVESKRFDPDHQGFNFIISPGASASAKPVTLTLNAVTYEQALQSVCELANVKYTVEGRTIHILSLAENPAVPKPVLPPNDKAAEATMHKLQTIVIDKINFEKLDIATVVHFLAFKSKELDPNHQGVNFVLGNINPGDNVHREVSITLDNDPLSDVLMEIAQQTNLHYSVGDNVVTFRP